VKKNGLRRDQKNLLDPRLDGARNPQPPLLIQASKRTSFLFCSLVFSFFRRHSQIPHSLFKENGYDHREALFGVPPYGGSIAQNVYYADSDLCDPNVDTTKGYPERYERDGKMEPWPSPYILMVDRGGCTFVKKVCFIIIENETK
jgi:hypothetical protein